MPGHLELTTAQLDVVADDVDSLAAAGVVTDTKTVWEARAFGARVGVRPTGPGFPLSSSAGCRYGSATSSAG